MVTIKRYPNRKLYDTESKQYITLEGVALIIQQGKEIQVVDHTSGEDLTARTLTQIIMGQERKRSGFLSDSFLTSLIRSSGDRLAALQRSLLSPQSFQHQVDEEIGLRIQSLVFAGELSEQAGSSLLDQLLSQAARMHEQHCLERSIATYVSQHQTPTRDDLKKLSDQLEAISSMLSGSDGSGKSKFDV